MFKDDKKKLLLKKIIEKRPYEFSYRNLFLKHKGPLSQKDRSGSHKLQQAIRDEISNAVKFYNWKPRSDQRYSVEFTFFANRPQPPELHQLVKCYLDEMIGLVFFDDIHVHHISAFCARPEKKMGDRNDEILYIKVMSIDNYNKKLWLCNELFAQNDIKRYLNLNDMKLQAFTQKIPDIEDLELDDYLQKYKALREAGIDEKTLALMELNDSRKFEKYLLSFFTIISTEYPGKSPKILHNPDIFSINVGYLPDQGCKSTFKKGVANALASSRITKLLRNKKIHSPFDILVNVNSKGATLGKDLDNIMREFLIPAFKPLYIAPNNYIEGYKIYFTPNASENAIRLKPLARFSINDFETALDEIIETAEEHL